MLGKGLESLIPPKKDNVALPPNDAAPMVALPPNDEPVHVPIATPGPEPIIEAPVSVVARAQEPAARPRIEHIAAQDEGESIFHIEIEKITPNPDQPRRNFDEAALQDLAHSIREFGFLQPLVVTKVGKETATGIDVEYQLIAGERRFMAAKMLGLRSVPAVVRNVNLEREKLELAVIENIQREGLSPIETARAFQRLQEEFRMTQREIAVKLGKSREVVANAMRLLDLPEYVRIAVEEGKLSESNARFLLAIEDPGAQKELFEDIVKNGLTTRDVKDRVKQVGPGPRRGRPPKSEEHLPPELKAMEQSLSSELGAPVTIHKGPNTGKITITFYSEEELESILQRLGREG